MSLSGLAALALTIILAVAAPTRTCGADDVGPAGVSAPNAALAPPEPTTPTLPDPFKLDAAFGPVLEPIQIIDAPTGQSGLFMAFSPPPVHVMENEGKLIWLDMEGRANVWAVAVYFWPELTMATIVLLLPWPLWRLWRVRRTPRAVGEAHCRRCNYQLTGVASATCPECGAKLTRRTRVVGRSRMRRTMPGVLALTSMVGLAGTLAALWSKPAAFRWMEDEKHLPRTGSVSQWFSFSSDRLQVWCVRNNVLPFIYPWQAYAKAWEIDLRTGDIDGVIYQNQLVMTDPPFFQPPAFAYIGDHVLIVDVTGWSVLDVQTRQVTRVADWDYPAMRYLSRESPALFSDDDSLMFEPLTYDKLTAWDTRNWKPRWSFRPQVEGLPARDRREVRDLAPVIGEAAAAVTLGEMNPNYSPSGDSPYWISQRTWLWWPREDRVIEIPVGFTDHGVTQYVRASGGRYLIGSMGRFQIGPTVDDNSVPIVWDMQTRELLPRLKHGAFEALPDRYADMTLAAVSRAEGKAYFYGYHTTSKWYEWNLLTGEAAAMASEPAGDLVWLTRQGQLQSLTTSIPSKMGDITVRRIGEHGATQTYYPPGMIDPDSIINSSATRFSPNQRLLATAFAYNGAAVYDLQSKQWIGRVAPGATITELGGLCWSDGGNLLVVTGQASTGMGRVAVYDMSKY